MGGGPEALTEHLPPQWFLSRRRLRQRFRGLSPQRVDARALGHGSAYAGKAAAGLDFAVGTPGIAVRVPAG